MSVKSLVSRRHHLSEFRDLFTALFRIADRDVQTRVLDAINGIVNDEPSGQCNCRKNLSLVDTGTQTTVEVSFKVLTDYDTKSVQTDSCEDLTIFGSKSISSEVDLIPVERGLKLSLTKQEEQSTNELNVANQEEKAPAAGFLKRTSSWKRVSSNEISVHVERKENSASLERNPAKRRKLMEAILLPDEPTLTVEVITENTELDVMSESECRYTLIPEETVSTERVQEIEIIPMPEEPQDIQQGEDSSMDSFKRPSPRFRSDDPASQIIKRRKRTKKIPRVEKVSDEETNHIESILQEKSFMGASKRIKRISFENATKNYVSSPKEIAHLFDLYTPDQIQQSVTNLEASKSIVEQMKHELEISLIVENGLYPIHRAILDNELSALRRQIYVLKFQKTNINKLLTDEDESPLQLAIKNNCILSLISELLKNGADANELDKDSNTTIHLAMMYSDSHKLLRLLLDNISYDALNMYNDNGSTALHIGVGEDKFMMCKTLLEFIDEKENLITIGKGVENKKKLIELYKSELNDLPKRIETNMNERKQKILNALNRKNGRTPLFLALSNRSDQAEVMILMLLAHFADPRVQDFTGTDSIAFAMDAYEVNRYNDALENSAMFFEKMALAAKKNNKINRII